MAIAATRAAVGDREQPPLCGPSVSTIIICKTQPASPSAGAND
jgi:hypothetical protein